MHLDLLFIVIEMGPYTQYNLTIRASLAALDALFPLQTIFTQGPEGPLRDLEKAGR